jgi:hypothetical protein
MRKNRHQDLSNLSRMGYAVLRAVLTRASQRRLIGADLTPDSWTASEAGSYLHAVAAAQGVQLEEYAEMLIERPPMRMAMLDRQRLAGATVAGS